MQRQLGARQLSPSPTLSPPWILSPEIPRVKIIGFTIFKYPALSNYHIPVSRICFLAGISKPQSRLSHAQLILLLGPAGARYFQILFWVSGIQDLDSWFGQVEMKELPGALYSTTVYKLISVATRLLKSGGY